MTMSILNSISGASAAAPPSEKDAMAVEKEGFLKLLVAQLGNQDPMQPQDSEAYVQQLTQFSTLEQLMNLNKGVDNLAMGQLSNNTQEAVRFVGRDVVAKGNTFNLDETGSASMRYNAAREAEKVTLTIHSENGTAVRTVTVPANRGGGTYEWDGLDDEGRTVAPGRYRVVLEATDAAGGPVPVDSFVRGQVTGVRFDEGFPELMIGDRRIRMSDVSEVR